MQAGNPTHEIYPELVEMLLSGNVGTFKSRLQSFINQIPDNKRSVNKEGFFPLFCLASFLALPDTTLGRTLGVKEVFCRIEKAGITKGVKLAVLSQKPQGVSSQQGNDKLVFIECFDTQPARLPDPKVHFSQQEINYLSNHIANYDTLEKVGYSIAMQHTTNPATHANTIMVEIPRFTANLAIPPHVNPGQDLFVVKKQEKNIENWISHLALEDKKEVKDNTEKILNYFGQEVNKYLTQDLKVNFTKEYEYHGLLTGFFVMLFKYHHNLKCYTELSLGEGFADIVILVRSPDRLLNTIPVIIELKKGRKDNISQQDKDQAKKYADAFWYGPQRMITNNKDIVYAVFNCDLEEDKRLWIKADTKNIDHQSFLRFLLQPTNQGEIKEQLKYIYYAIPNEAPGYYSYSTKMLLGQLIATTPREESWEKYVFKYGQEARISRTGSAVDMSGNISTFGFVNPEQKMLVLLNVTRGNVKHPIPENKKVEIGGIVGGNEDIKITEVYLTLKSEKATKGEFEDWCQDIKVNSYNNLQGYNDKKAQNFQGEFSEVDIDTEALNTVLSRAVAVMRQPNIQPDDARYYIDLFKEISKHLFNFKESINSEDDFQAVLQGVFTHYSDAQFRVGNNERISVVPEMQSGGGYRVDIGLVGKKVFVGIELKFDATQGTSKPKMLKNTAITTKAQEAENQLARYKEQPNNIKSLTDGDEAAMLWAVFHKKATTPESLIEVRSEFDTFPVVHSSMHIIGDLIIGDPMDTN